MATGCFISTGRSLQSAVERVKLAESLGYEAVYVTHIAGRESLTVLGAYATATSTIRLGTGVVPIYTRTPATMAQTAATLDELSGGRLRLGLGVSHRPVVESWHGQTIDRPVAEMREYASIVRAILRGEDPPAGEKWRTSFHLLGLEPRPALPIYIAGLSPAMLRLAGEIADGVVLWLCNPRYIREVVIPAVREGRERAGLTLDGFDVVAAVPAALTASSAQQDARERAFDAMRADLIPYFGLPFYRTMIERTGFAADIAAYDAAAGDLEKMKRAISNEFLEELTAVGDGQDLAEGIERYRRAGAGSPCIGPIPGTDFEATLRAGI
ncbi:MAG TPA: LLM class flavin-dependent oxidoreductase [Solirubrobacteraceae bacterium]|jgi:alkanesulfonate monooxygenase SsuD/methylene tetrahydromethanopterin reductase-like flavin-dependent oxidoreductase (luciferase family)|nr:LLM class flavin-dependent oxidoreductase [Solirubrobacteraceae bacterium]